MKSPILFIWMLAGLFAPHLAAESPVPFLAGNWKLLGDRGTDLSPWKTLDVAIAVDRDRVVIRRHFASGDRAIDTEMSLDVSNPVNIVPVPSWVDNRHIGAYIGGDRSEHIHAAWIDDGRILRTDADLVLDTQQGARKVYILTDYKISPSGNQLTIVELRSTRPIPIVYVLQRSRP